MADANGGNANNSANNDAGAGGNGTSDTSNNNQTGAAGGQDGAHDGSTNTWDPAKELSKEQWDAIYSSGRFKSLNDKAKLADKLQKDADAAERKRLEDEGKWQDLATKNEEKATRYQTAAISAKIEAVAAQQGSVDPEAVAALISKDGISISDDLTVTGVEEAISTLKESKPYLFNNSSNNPKLGSGTNPGDGNNQGTPKFTHTQIQDPKFFQEHEADIMQALKNNQVVDDRKN